MRHHFTLARPARITHRTIFLDRDGVINRKAPEGDYVKSWKEFDFLPGALNALCLFAKYHVRVVVLTNQRGIALGRYSLSDLAKIHDNMVAAAEAVGGRLDDIYFCPHDIGVCTCRKPAPGLVREALADYPDIVPNESPFLGDSRSDLEAARAAGVPPWHLTLNPKSQLADLTFPSLLAAAEHLIQACST